MNVAVILILRVVLCVPFGKRPTAKFAEADDVSTGLDVLQDKFAGHFHLLQALGSGAVEQTNRQRGRILSERFTEEQLYASNVHYPSK